MIFETAAPQKKKKKKKKMTSAEAILCALNTYSNINDEHFE